MTLKFIVMYSCRIVALMLGVMWIEFDYDKSVDYKHYLGPDWKLNFDGAFIYVSNHLGFIDVMISGFFLYPSYLARSSAKNNPFIKLIGDAAGIVWVTRVGEGSKESKSAAIKAIGEHIRLN
jgi:1-acyl-sn-glycerol-3-phosphate acyltransferase